MTIRPLVLSCVACIIASSAAAQTNGSIIGHVRQRDAEAGRPVVGAEIGVDGRWLATTDSTGFYRIREVRSGWHVVTMRAIGFETMRRDSVLVRASQVTVVNFTAGAYTIEQIVVEAYADSILDPSLVATVHAAGGRVIVWTVDDRDQMKELLDLGVDGIMTDRPDLLREVLDGRARTA